MAIHDGARPLVTADVIARTLESAQKFGSGVAAVALKDTVKRVDEDSVVVDTRRATNSAPCRPRRRLKRG